LKMKSYDTEAFQYMPVLLKSGRYPEKPGEIVLSDSVFFNGGVEYEIGDTITLDIGDRVDQDVIVNDEPIITETETIAVNDSRTYTVTGIIERPRFEQSSPAYSVITYLDENELSPQDPVNISAILKSPRKIFDHVPEIAEGIGLHDSQITYNNELLKWMG